MSILNTDLRLALPAPVRRATVVGGLTEWERGLADAGVEVNGPGRADLVVAPANRAEQAIHTGAPAIVLEGRTGRRALAQAGYAVRRFLALPSIERPHLILPLERGPAISYALSEWRPARTRTKRGRDRLVGTLVQAGALPPLRAEQILGLREPGQPFAIAAARELGLPEEAAWFMFPGESADALSRLVFVLFAPGDAHPSWVVKLARVPSVREPFDRDEQGLGLAATAGGAIAAHAPVLVGRFEPDRLQASVETAALGEPLSSLVARDPEAARTAIDDIADWIVDFAGGGTSNGALDQERRRLRDQIMPRWFDQGAPADLVDRVPELRGVLQHNDIGSWNIVVEGPGRFVVVDWESACPSGLPLWDLLYFLVDALPLLEGARTSDERLAAAVRLVRGDSPLSPVLFAWLRRGAEAAGVPEHAIGPVATLCWLHHGLSHVSRREAAELVEAAGGAAVSPVDLLAPVWLSDPALGTEWKARPA